MNKDVDRFIMPLREINKNGSVGLTFPKKISEKYKIKGGKFKSKCYKKDEKFIIEIDLIDILHD
jgi:hypothetical protein